MALKVSLNLKDNASAKLKGFAGSLGKMTKNFVKFGAVGALAIGGIALKLSGDFSKGLAEVTTLMDDLTTGEIRAMEKELKGLASTTGLALNSLTKAKYDVVSAGFASAAESAIVLNEAAKLAVAGVTSAASAADLLTTSLNAYGKSADESQDVSDILFTTVRLGKTTMTELASSMGQMLPMARAAKVSLADVSAALAVVTTNGISTAEATTSINAAMQALSAPTDQSRDAMKEAGIEIKKFDDGTTDLVATMAQFKGMDPAVLKEFIPNIRAIKSIQILAGDVEGLADAIESMNNRAGASGKAFDKMNAEWNTTMSKLKNNIQNGLISLGDVIKEKLQPIVDEANTMLQKIGEIGWGVVAKTFADNWGTILVFLGAILDAWVQVVRSKFSKMINNIVQDFGTFFKVLLGVSDSWLEEQSALWDEFETQQKTTLSNSLQGFKQYADALIAEAARSAAADPIPKPGGAGGSPSPEDDPSSDPRVLAENEVAFLLDEIQQKQAVTQRDMFNATALDYANSLEGRAKKFKGWADQVGAAGGALLNLRKAQIQKELQADIQSVLDSGASEEVKASKIKNLKEQAVQDEKNAAKALKPIRVAQAIAEGALLVIRAAQTKPFIPVGLASMALAGVVAGANIATVIAQPYATGGTVSMARGGSVPVSDVVPALLRRNEIVSTPEANDQFGDEITRMNQIASGGGQGGGGREINVNITATDGQSVYRMLVENKAEVAQGLIELVDSGHIQGIKA